MPLVNFRKNISLLFFWFLPEFRSSNSFAVTEHTRNQLFGEISKKKNFFKMFTWLLSDRFLNVFQNVGFYSRNLHFNLGLFWKLKHAHAEHTQKWFYRTLSIRGNDLNAGWAYEEMISSLTEHTRKCLKVEYRGRIEFDFQKMGP